MHAVIDVVAATHRILLGETELIIRSRVYLHFYSTRIPGIFHTLSYDTYILVVRCMKQNKDAVWSLVLLLGTGVRARTHMISYICT